MFKFYAIVIKFGWVGFLENYRYAEWEIRQF